MNTSSDFSSGWNVIIASVEADQWHAFSSRLTKLFAFSPEECDAVLNHLPVLFLSCPTEETGSWLQKQLQHPGAEILLRKGNNQTDCYVLVWPEAGTDPSENFHKISLLPPLGQIQEDDELNQRIAVTKALYQNLDAKLEGILNKKVSDVKDEALTELDEAKQKSEEQSQVIEKLKRELENLAIEKNKTRYFLMQFRRAAALQQSIQEQFHRQYQETRQKEEQNTILKDCIRELTEAGQSQENFLREKAAEWEILQKNLQQKQSDLEIALEKQAKDAQEKIQELEEAARSQEIFLKKKMDEWARSERIFQQAQVELQKVLASEQAKFDESQKAYVSIWAKLNETEQKASHEKSKLEITIRQLEQKTAELEKFKQTSEQEFEKKLQKTKDKIQSFEDEARKRDIAWKEKAEEWARVEGSYRQTQVELNALLANERALKEETRKETERVLSDLRKSEQENSRQKEEYNRQISELERKAAEASAAKNQVTQEFEKQIQEAQEKIDLLEKAIQDDANIYTENKNKWDEDRKAFEEKRDELQGLLAREMAVLAETLKKHSEIEIELKTQLENAKQNIEAYKEEVRMLADSKTALEEELQRFRDKTKQDVEKIIQAEETLSRQSEKISWLETEMSRSRDLFQSKLEELADTQRLASGTESELRALVEKESARADALEDRLKAELIRSEEQTRQEMEDREKIRNSFVAEQARIEQEWQQRYSALETIKEGILSALRVEHEQSEAISESYKNLQQKLSAAEEEILIWKKETVGLEKKISDLEASDGNEEGFQNQGSQPWQADAPQKSEESISLAGKSENHLRLMLELEDQKMRAQEWERKTRELEKEVILLKERLRN